jgi:uncharacterized membrane protein YebE (DUF533 family)
MVKHLEERIRNLSEYTHLVKMAGADGWIDDLEKRELKRKQYALKVTQQQHDAIIAEMLNWGTSEQQRPELRKYRTILWSAAEDGFIDEEEKQELLEFRQENDITDGEHQLAMLELLSAFDGSAPALAAMSATESPIGGSQAASTWGSGYL